ncbi:MAG TPA: HmuY family protein, partial [Cyclobacteriaceae bacterium]|nr:HmuY family protein [Cyclobacteriaceae bacterium]
MNKMKYLMLIVGLCASLMSCEDDPKLPDNEVGFEAAVAGISAEETSLDINIALSRKASSDVTLTVGLTSTGIIYGTDFTTSPEASNNVISVVIPKGEIIGTITLSKVNGVGFTGDEEVSFSITAVEGSPVLSEITEIKVSFSEITVVNGALNILGGGAAYPNKVFIDLSGNRQTSVARTSWDFGFSSGDDFRVILNSSNGMMARALDKTNLNDVTAADTAGFGKQLSLSAVFAAITSNSPPAWVSSAITWIDDPTGNLAGTAIAGVSATAADNKVYIVNLGDGPGTPAPNLGWKKIRIVRNGNGYTLQHANINATTFSEIQIAKDATFAFQYVSLATGSVSVEPAVKKWDIAWTGFTNSTNFGSGPVPYYFQDIILQNTTGVQTVQILTSTKTYEAFAESDLTGLDFGTQSQVK